MACALAYICSVPAPTTTVAFACTLQQAIRTNGYAETKQEARIKGCKQASRAFSFSFLFFSFLFFFFFFFLLQLSSSKCDVLSSRT